VNRGSYFVIMGAIIVPTVTNITVLKNMMNFSPRSILSISLSGEGGQMPMGSCTIHTRTNVQDFFKINDVLMVIKRAGSAAEIAQAVAALSYMGGIRYNDSTAQAKLLAMVSAGYLPVFMGATAGFHSVWVSNANYTGYEYIVSAYDFTAYLNNTVMNLTINDEPKVRYNASMIAEKLRKSNSAYIGEKTINNKHVETLVGRQAFINSGIDLFLNHEKQYKGYKNNLNLTPRDILPGAEGNQFDVSRMAEAGLIKQCATFKVPSSFEAKQEAVPYKLLESLFRVGMVTDSNRIDNLNWIHILENLAPAPFYESFVREDTGEFVCRRAGWINKKMGAVRQKYQNPSLPIYAPLNNMIDYEKLSGLKYGSTPLVNTPGQYQFNPSKLGSVSFDLGEQNQLRFGKSKISQDYSLFRSVHTMFSKGSPSLENRDNAFVFSDLFFSDKHYTDDVYPLKSNSNISYDDDELRTRAETTAEKMMSWFAKYYYGMNYALWVGFSTYFVAPLGAPMQLTVPATQASVYGTAVTGLAAIEVATRNSGIFSGSTDAFTSFEALSSYPILGKTLSVAVREDGSYQEEYHLLLGHTAPGFRLDQ